MHWWTGFLVLATAVVSVVAIIAGAAALDDTPCLVPQPSFSLPAWLITSGSFGAGSILFYIVGWCARADKTAARWLWVIFAVVFAVFVLPLMIIGVDLLLRQSSGSCASFAHTWSIVVVIVQFIALLSAVFYLPALRRLESDVAREVRKATDSSDESIGARTSRRRRTAASPATSEDFDF